MFQHNERGGLDVHKILGDMQILNTGDREHCDADETNSVSYGRAMINKVLQRGSRDKSLRIPFCFLQRVCLHWCFDYS